MRKIILSLSLISSFFYTEAQTTTSTTQSTDDKVKNLSTLMAAMPKITGFLDLRYQYSNEANNYASGRNGFDVGRVYLGMSGAVTKDLTYRVLADFETTPKILDALVEYKPLSFLSVQAGQFKTPLTLENPYSPATLETAEFSQAVTALVTDIDGNKNNGRDIRNQGRYRLRKLCSFQSSRRVWIFQSQWSFELTGLYRKERKWFVFHQCIQNFGCCFKVGQHAVSQIFGDSTGHSQIHTTNIETVSARSIIVSLIGILVTQIEESGDFWHRRHQR
jgi:hypothetical protein